MGRSPCQALGRLASISRGDVPRLRLPLKSQLMLVRDAADFFYLSMQGVLSDATIAWYQQRVGSLVEHVGDQPVGDVTTNDLRRWRAALCARESRWRNGGSPRPPADGGLSDATIRGYVRAARRLFNWLVDEGEIEKSPARRLRMPPKPKNGKKGVEKADRLAMLEAVKDDPRDLAVLMFVWETGCRREGVAGLMLGDLDLDGRKAVVTEKGNKSREVYFSSRCRDALSSWLSERESESESVFVGKRGPLTVWGIYDIFKRAAKAAGVEKNWSPHEWRHARARCWLQNGMSLAHVSQLLGHADVAVTVAHYGIFANGDLQEIFDKYTQDGDSPRDS